MGIGRVIGQWIGAKAEERKRSDLEERLESFGLSEGELDEVEPYVDYVAENGGGVGKLIAMGLIAIVGVLFILFGAVVPLPMPLVVFFLLGGLFFIGLAGFTYRKRQKAKNLRQALLSHPETFVEGEPHPYHSIADD